MFGATGKHTAQILQGLDVDLLLAADSRRPRYLEQQGLVIEGSRVTYAIGQLALWSNDVSPLSSAQSHAAIKTLLATSSGHVAVANPKLAPYGQAALEAINSLGLKTALSERLVLGENITQAFQFVSTGNAQFGFVARSQLNLVKADHYWMVPVELHTPIEQQMVLLSDSQEAKKFHQFLLSDVAVGIIRQHGYHTPQ